jgi:hypothetical protein
VDTRTSRIALVSAVVLSIGLLVGVGGATALAQSPSPAASPASACADLVAALPPTVDGAALQIMPLTGAGDGAAGQIGALLGPALQGLAQGGMCMVAFSYGTDTQSLDSLGFMFRFAGMPSDSLSKMVGALGGMMCTSAASCAPSTATVGGKTVTQIRGPMSTMDLYVAGDTLLLVSDGPVAEAVLAALPAGTMTSPGAASSAAPSASPAG